jgi:hypothetical protein
MQSESGTEAGSEAKFLRILAGMRCFSSKSLIDKSFDYSRWKAIEAAAIAFCASILPMNGTCAMISPVAGLFTWKTVLP